MSERDDDRSGTPGRGWPPPSDDRVYRPPGWSDVADLFAPLSFARSIPVAQWLEERASLLLTGWHDGHPAAAAIASNWHPDLIGDPDRLASEPANEHGAQLMVARELGFADWGQAVSVSAVIDPDFESSVDAILAADEATLAQRIAARPELVWQRSAFGHRASLLHYLASNGVETERQVVPGNGASLIAVLLAAGADPAAEMLVYGGRFTTQELLETSAHPWEAGLGEAMLAALQQTD